jgi:hypothetical protein
MASFGNGSGNCSGTAESNYTKAEEPSKWQIQDIPTCSCYPIKAIPSGTQTKLIIQGAVPILALNLPFPVQLNYFCF